MNIDIIIIGCIAVLSGLYALFNIFGLVGLSCGIAVMLIYVLLLRLKPRNCLLYTSPSPRDRG